MPLDGRGLLRRTLASLGEARTTSLAGLEAEFSVVIRSPEQLAPENAGFTPPPPPVSVFERGYQFLSEVRLDSMGGTLEAIRDALYDIGLPPRSIEDEWGRVSSSSVRAHGRAVRGRPAVLLRSAVEQVRQRRGPLATFMCRRRCPNFFSSGRHLHQSRRPGLTLERVRQRVGRASTWSHYVAGLLAHVPPTAVFGALTVNGYSGSAVPLSWTG